MEPFAHHKRVDKKLQAQEAKQVESGQDKFLAYLKRTQTPVRPKSTKKPYKDSQLMDWIRNLRLVLSNRVGNMGKWILALDEDRDGFLDETEFKKFLTTYHIKPDEEQLKRLWDLFDADKSGKISVFEMVGAIDCCDKLETIIRREASDKWLAKVAETKRVKALEKQGKFEHNYM